MRIYRVYITGLITIVLGCSIAIAQKPQKIEGIAKEEKPVSYYQEQSELWNQLISKDPRNTEAWLNYYKAERAKLQLQKPDIWANDKTAFYETLTPIITKAKNSIGNSFEYYYIKGLNTGRDKSIQSLKKAYAIDSDRSEVYGWLLVHYIQLFDKTKCRELGVKILQSNIYSDANLKWNYNALQSVEKNGIIVTNGDMDTEPKWALQFGDNIREDVLVVNKWLLADNSDYRENILKKMDIDFTPKQQSDFANMSEYADYLAVELLRRAKQPIYTSSGTSIQFFRDHNIENKMYLVGNALKYSEQSFDNTAVIKKNFEEKYYLEYLFKSFQYHQEDEVVKGQMNLTYLPGLIHMRDHYKSKKQTKKYNHYNALINKIAMDSGKKDKVLSWFETKTK